MSHQGEISDGAGFGLIETLLWTRRDGFFLLDAHLSRLAASAQELGFVCDAAQARALLAGAAAAAPAERLRLRLVLSRGGAFEIGATPVDPVPPDTVWRVVLARRRFSSADPLLRHKTTRREIYETELAEAVARDGADEVIFLNERDEVCEGARSNVFALVEGVLLTPPLSCGLLPGTMRARRLSAGGARAEILSPGNLLAASELYMCNSVRGFVRARLIEGPRSAARAREGA